MATCLMTRAEDAHAARLERKDTAREVAKAELAAEYMAAASMPFITTIATPGNHRPRIPFLESFGDEVSEHKVGARVVSILMRSDEGRELLAELAEKHAEYFCDEVNPS